MIKNYRSFNTPGERLRYIREELLNNLSRAKLNKKYGISEDTLKFWEGSDHLGKNALQACINLYLNENIVLTEEWIAEGKGVCPKVYLDLSRYFNELSAPYENSKVHDEILMLKEIDFFKNSSSNAVVYLIKDESMLPFYAPKDYVGGRFRVGEDALKFCTGKDCIIEIKNNEKLFGRLTRNKTNDGYNLTCLNPAWGSVPQPIIFNIDIVCAAPVIWHRRFDYFNNLSS
jgi:hypothetical protein